MKSEGLPARVERKQQSKAKDPRMRTYFTLEVNDATERHNQWVETYGRMHKRSNREPRATKRKRCARKKRLAQDAGAAPVDLLKVRSMGEQRPRVTEGAQEERHKEIFPPEPRTCPPTSTDTAEEPINTEHRSGKVGQHREGRSWHRRAGQERRARGFDATKGYPGEGPWHQQDWNLWNERRQANQGDQPPQTSTTPRRSGNAAGSNSSSWEWSSGRWNWESAWQPQNTGTASSSWETPTSIPTSTDTRGPQWESRPWGTGQRSRSQTRRGSEPPPPARGVKTGTREKLKTYPEEQAAFWGIEWYTWQHRELEPPPGNPWNTLVLTNLLQAKPYYIDKTNSSKKKQTVEESWQGNTYRAPCGFCRHCRDGERAKNAFEAKQVAALCILEQLYNEDILQADWTLEVAWTRRKAVTQESRKPRSRERRSTGVEPGLSSSDESKGSGNGRPTAKQGRRRSPPNEPNDQKTHVQNYSGKRRRSSSQTKWSCPTPHS